MRVEADQAAQPPAVLVKVRLHHVVTGVEVDRKAVEDAIGLSEEKYCSVGAMIRKSAEFDSTFEIRELAVEEDYQRAAEAVVAWQKGGTLDAGLRHTPSGILGAKFKDKK